MEKISTVIARWSANQFHQIMGFGERQGIGNVIQDEDALINMIILLAFVVAYSISLSIAISGIFRKYLTITVYCVNFLNWSIIKATSK